MVDNNEGDRSEVSGGDRKQLKVGDRFVGWAQTLVRDSDENLKPVVVFDEFIRKAKNTVPDDIIGVDPEDVDLERRMVLKIVGSGVTIATTGYTIHDMYNDITETPLHHYQMFWPNSLYNFADNESVNDLEEILNESARSWPEFTEESTSMLSSVSNETVEIVAFYFRAYDNDFYQAIKDVHQSTSSLNLYFADPRPYMGVNELSPLELHQMREVLIHNHLVNHPELQNVLVNAPPGTEFDPVPHINHIKLNQIRSLTHALRSIHTLLYFDNKLEKVSLYPITDTKEQPLRARILGDYKASFVRMPKGMIGTADPTRGHITDATPLIQELKAECQRIRGRPVKTAELQKTYDILFDRVYNLIDKEETEGTLPTPIANSLRESAEMFKPPGSWDETLTLSFEAWKRDNDTRFRVIKEGIEPDISEADPPEFGEVASIVEEPIKDYSLLYERVDETLKKQLS